MARRVTHLVWDWNGTILDDGGARRSPAPVIRGLLPANRDQLIATELMYRIEEVGAQRMLGASRDALAGALRELLPEWDFTLPRGGMSIWVRLPGPIGGPVADAAYQRGVRVVPGPAFGADGLLDSYLRLPFVLPPADLREGVARMAAAYRDVRAAPPPRAFAAYV